MRKLWFSFLLVTFLLPIPAAFADFNLGTPDVGSRTSYQPWRNEYRTDFGWPPESEWSVFRIYFETSSSVVYETEYTPEEVAGQIMYLTCNGTYQFFFDDALENEVFWTGLIETSAITSPPCSSYPDGGTKNDLDADYEDQTDGSGYKVNWEDTPGATEYEVWKDGELIDTIPATGGPYSADIDSPGGVSIVAKDDEGDYITHSDLQVPDYEDWEAAAGECGDVCQKIRDALACPEWDEYMGELTAAIQAALPPPPDWPSIADVFVGKLADYFGDVPTVPSKEDIGTEITPPLPSLDTAVPDADLEPSVPDEFDEPMTFDITDGPEIAVVDDSEAIEIYEPDEFIDSDDPGVMVYPGDEDNHSDGIKQPDTIETEYEMPTPAIPDDYETPPSDMPIPSAASTEVPDDPMPTPSDPGGDGPIPGQEEEEGGGDE